LRHIIDKFNPQGGNHCITNALKQVFCYYEHPLSEEMIFGVASGLAFTYINLANSPMVSGRTKPFEFERKLAERLNITIKCKQSKSYETVLKQAKTMINRDQPVLVYADMPFMKYLNLDETSHFGGHAVVLYGYDDDKQAFYVSDRDNHDYPVRTPNGEIAKDYHLVSYGEMEQARSSTYKPFPARNKYLKFDFNGFNKINENTIICAIDDTCNNMLNPPANLSGINGIEKFSKEVLKWKKFDTEKLKTAGITNYFQINRDGGTGGGIFRKMYGRFLIEADTILTGRKLELQGNCYIQLSKQWELVSDLSWELGKTGDTALLPVMSRNIKELYEQEKSILLQVKKSVE